MRGCGAANIREGVNKRSINLALIIFDDFLPEQKAEVLSSTGQIPAKVSYAVIRSTRIEILNGWDFRSGTYVSGSATKQKIYAAALHLAYIRHHGGRMVKWPHAAGQSNDVFSYLGVLLGWDGINLVL